MTLADLLLALSERRVRAMLDGAGTSLRIRREEPAPDLIDGIKVRKADIIAALQEARSTAIDLHRAGDADEFECELHVARDAGRITVADWCAGLLAVEIARRWQAEQTNSALAA